MNYQSILERNNCVSFKNVTVSRSPNELVLIHFEMLDAQNNLVFDEYFPTPDTIMNFGSVPPELWG